MNKMDAGMYVRTKDGFIDEVIIKYQGYCNNPNCKCKHVSCKYNYYDEENIVKASHNIIDLIQVGDYVNGYLVTTVSNGLGSIYVDLRDDLGYRTKLYEPNIKSIVTREQFSNMEYRIGD